ncbi:hypothetical protein CASFOL_002694 [Castilleja foliolosa]|uniref:Uncharacterized protein n=1 Tax=Castilleja foliolosa TaxID=1961234 RepID=A0ABD3EFB5_9LAMI
MAKMRLLGFLVLLLVVSDCLVKARPIGLAEKRNTKQKKLTELDNGTDIVTNDDGLKDHRSCPLPDFTRSCSKAP